MNGALTGGMMYLVLLAISLTVPRNEVGLLALYKCLLMLGGGAIGGILAVNHHRHRAAIIRYSSRIAINSSRSRHNAHRPCSGIARS